MSKKIFCFALCAMLFALSFPAQAQKPGKVYRIGYLFTGISAGDKSLLAAFRQGLQELGYLEGKNIVIEYRMAARKRDRYPAMEEELIRLKVEIIVTGGGGARAAKKASSTIPIAISLPSSIKSRWQHV